MKEWLTQFSRVFFVFELKFINKKMKKFRIASILNSIFKLLVYGMWSPNEPRIIYYRFFKPGVFKKRYLNTLWTWKVKMHELHEPNRNV